MVTKKWIWLFLNRICRKVSTNSTFKLLGKFIRFIKFFLFSMLKFKQCALKMYYTHFINAAGESGNTDNVENKNNSTKITVFYYSDMYIYKYIYVYTYIYLLYKRQLILCIHYNPLFSPNSILFASFHISNCCSTLLFQTPI